MNDQEKIEWYNQTSGFPDARRDISKSNWICVDCRLIIRHPKGNSHIPICSKCGQETIYFGDKFQAPRKEDDKSWKELKKLIEKRKT